MGHDTHIPRGVEHTHNTNVFANSLPTRNLYINHTLMIFLFTLQGAGCLLLVHFNAFRAHFWCCDNLRMTDKSLVLRFLSRYNLTNVFEEKNEQC
jgi:hypothetical protein